MDGPSSTLSGRKRGRGGSSSLGTTPSRTMGSGRSSNTTSTPVVHRVESSDDRVRASQLRDPKQRIKALNAILKLSSSHDINYALSGDSVLGSLCRIALECMEWNGPKGGDNNSGEEEEGVYLPPFGRKEDTVDPVFSSATAWTTPPTLEMQEWAQHWKEEFSSTKRSLKDPTSFQMLEVIVAILRNFSYVGANLRMLAYTPQVVAILIGCCYERHDNCGAANTGNQEYRGYIPRAEQAAQMAGVATDKVTALAKSRISLTANALQTLLHLTPYLDVSGQKLLTDRLFYAPHTAREGPLVPDAASFGQTAGGNWGFGGMWLAKRLDVKEDVMMLTPQLTKELLLAASSFGSDYLVAVWSIFPALTHVLTNPQCPRTVMIMAVDLLQELINQARVGVVGSVDLDDPVDALPTLRALLVRIPDQLLERLMDLLYIPRSGPDSMEYLDPLTNLVSRVTPLKLVAGYESTIDTDLRDRALDVLVPLLELDSPRMALRLGMQKQQDSDKTFFMVRRQLWDSLVPILTSTGGRNDAPLLAAQLFRELAKAPGNRSGLQYIQGRMVELASKDHRVSHLVWNYLYKQPTTTSDSNDLTNGEEQGSSSNHPSEYGAGEEDPDAMEQGQDAQDSTEG